MEWDYKPGIVYLDVHLFFAHKRYLLLLSFTIIIIFIIIIIITTLLIPITYPFSYSLHYHLLNVKLSRKLLKKLIEPIVTYFKVWQVFETATVNLWYIIFSQCKSFLTENLIKFLERNLICFMVPICCHGTVMPIWIKKKIKKLKELTIN